jgi:hypothetical protein
MQVFPQNIIYRPTSLLWDHFLLNSCTPSCGYIPLSIILVLWTFWTCCSTTSIIECFMWVQWIARCWLAITTPVCIYMCLQLFIYDFKQLGVNYGSELREIAKLNDDPMSWRQAGFSCFSGPHGSEKSLACHYPRYVYHHIIRPRTELVLDPCPESLIFSHFIGCIQQQRWHF